MASGARGLRAAQAVQVRHLPGYHGLREPHGGSALAVRADVSHPEVCTEMFDQVLAWRGHIDALVHCAGPFHRVDVLEETAEGWRAMFANNLDSLFFLSRLVAPSMK